MAETKTTKTTGQNEPAALPPDAPAAVRWAAMLDALEPARALAEGQARGGRYRYAPLPEVMRAVVPVLRHHGFALFQGIEVADAGGHIVWTRVVDSASGEPMTEAFVAIPAGLGPQELGSWITYARRYEIGTVCGLVVEEDDDAQSAQASHEARRAGGSGGGKAAGQPKPQERSFESFGPVLVREIRVAKQGARKDGTPYTMWGVAFEDGREETTFSDTVVDVLSSAKKTGRPVTATVERRGRFSSITSVEVAEGEPETSAPAKGGPDDDLPF